MSTSSSAPARSAARSARGSRATGTRCSSATPTPSTSPRSTSGGLRDRGPGRAVHGRGARPSRPDELPDGLGAVLLAVKSQHTAAALAAIAPRPRAGRLRRLAPERRQRAADRRRPSARSGRSARSSTSARTTSGRGGSSSAGAEPFYVGELDGRRERAGRAARARPRRRAERRTTSSAILWAKEAYGAMLFATAVSDLSIADALAEPRYRPLFVRLAREVLAAAPVARSRSTASTPTTSTARSSGSSSSTAARRRRTRASTATSRCASGRPRRRSSTDSTGRCVRRTLELIHEIEDGGARLRGREPRPARRVRAPARSGRRALNAVITMLPPGERGRRRAAARRRRSPSRTTSTSRGVVTTNASTVGVPPPAERDATVVAPPARRRRRAPLQDEPARVRGRQRQPGVRDDLQPARREPHVGRVEQRLGRARRGRRVRPRARHRHRRLDPHPGRVLRHRRAQADVRARSGRRASSRCLRRATTSAR